MDDAMLWLVGGLALAIAVAALVWVLRHRSGRLPDEHHHGYAAPAVTESDTQSRAALIFGGEDPGSEVVVDVTVPRSRLGGAGWRDGTPVPTEPTTGAAVADTGTWAEDPVEASDPLLDHHVAVDEAGARPVVDAEADRRRGGHW